VFLFRTESNYLVSVFLLSPPPFPACAPVSIVLAFLYVNSFHFRFGVANFVDQVFGVLITALIILQIMLGYYHHQRYVLDRPTSRRWFTHAHLWLGRVVILTGLINCGTGLDLANVSTAGQIAWYVVWAVLATVYAIAVFVTIRWRAGRAKENVFSPERYKTTEAYEMSLGGPAGGL